MTDSTFFPIESASQEVFEVVESNLPTGPTRDLWWNIRSELNDAGPESVRTHLQAEFQSKHAEVQAALAQLRQQFEEMA